MFLRRLVWMRERKLRDADSRSNGRARRTAAKLKFAAVLCVVWLELFAVVVEAEVGDEIFTHNVAEGVL